MRLMKNMVLVPSGTFGRSPCANLPISFAIEVNHSSPSGPILRAGYRNALPVIGSRGTPVAVLALCQDVCGALLMVEGERLRLLMVAAKCFDCCLVLWVCVFIAGGAR